MGIEDQSSPNEKEELFASVKLESQTVLSH